MQKNVALVFENTIDEKKIVYIFEFTLIVERQCTFLLKFSMGQ